MFRRLIPTLVLITAVVPSSALAETPQAAGSEFAVNEITTVNQGYSRAAADANGNFVVTWEAAGGLDGDSWGVLGRTFDPSGAPQGIEFQVNSFTPGLQVYPSLAVRPSGEFTVVWQSDGQDGDNFGVFAQRFDSDATAVGGEIAVNTTTAGYQGNTQVAYRDDGGFLVVWEHTAANLNGDDIRGRLFDSSGVAVGGELMINTTTASDQNDPRLVSRAGGFIAVWESLGQDGDLETVIMQLLDESGSPVGGEVQVNETTASDQEDPEIAVSENGTFTVVWESLGQDGSDETAMARIFDSAGTPTTGEFQLNTATLDDQEEVDVASDGAGGFVAVWESTGQLGEANEEDVFGQRFDGAGQLVGDEFQVNTYTVLSQDVPHITAAEGGRLVVTWRDFGQKCCSAGVFGQLLDVPLFTDGFESGDTSVWNSTTP